MSKVKFLSIAAVCASHAIPAHADQVFNEDVIINGNSSLCVGFFCDDDDPIPATIQIRNSTPSILFTDALINPDSANDWKLRANGQDGLTGKFFQISDQSAGLVPFHIDAGSPENAFFLESSGNIGFQTALPLTDLHIIDTLQTELRLETTKDSDWAVGAVQSGFYITDEFNDNRVFRILNGAPDGAMTIINNGNVGFGTQGPDAPLEVSSDSTFTFFRLTAEDAATNQSVDITFTGGPLGTGQLRYNIVDGDAQEMSLDADGNMILDGTLTTSGPTCAGGCDRVFDEDYSLLSIEDHAELMFANKHLPAVGPTEPHAPVNLPNKMGNMLNSLEHAHIYIAQLQSQLRNEQTHSARQTDQIERLVTRLDAMEIRLDGGK